MQILEKTELISLPDGRKYTRPTSQDYDKEELICREQETLMNRMVALSQSEEDQGKFISMQRKVAKLELEKHPLLRVWNKHLAPARPGSFVMPKGKIIGLIPMVSAKFIPS